MLTNAEKQKKFREKRQRKFDEMYEYIEQIDYKCNYLMLFIENELFKRRKKC